jgi:hypothetical protein
MSEVVRADPYGSEDRLATGQRQCTAKSKRTGERCRQFAMENQNVCRAHGGKAPQSLAAAKRRLAEAADPAAARLVAEMSTGDRSFDRIKAAAAVLDRAGITRPDAVELAEAEKQRLQLVVASAFRAAVERAELAEGQRVALVATFMELLREADR